MDKLQQLQQLREQKDPSLKLSRLLVEKYNLAKGEKGDTGEAGYSPVKGKDYYTESEINSVINYIQSKVKDGAKGDNGIDGKKGDTGYAPELGIDYWTTKDQEKILKDVLTKIPKPKDGISPKTEDIVNSAVDILKKNPIEFKDIKGTEKLIEFLRMGGFRGGGLSTVSHDATLTGDGTPGNPLTVASIPGSGITSLNTDISLAQTLTVGTTGTDFAIVDNGTGDHKFNLPTASATNRGALSTTDWSAFNGKQNALGFTPENVANKSTNVTTDGASDTKYPSVKAVKTYADGLVVGLLDYRGGYDASVNTYPAAGGSGTAGAVMKGDMWVISVAGTLGGVAIQIGDSIIANVDTPGQTAGNWNTLNSNISYVPEDQANKVTSISGASTDVQYPSAKLLYDQLALKQTLATNLTSLAGLSYVSASFVKMTAAGTFSLDTNTYATTASLGSYLPLAGGTLTGNLLFTDNTLDIGASGATRPRTLYLGTSVFSPLLIGGTGTTSTLALQSTSGVGGTSSWIKFLTGSNGGTENGRMGVVTLPGVDGTGGAISHNGGNTIHTFLLADTGTAFTPPAGVSSVTYLVIAGGGGGAGGRHAGGGGGAGAMLTGTQAVTAGTPYAITVGDGGAGNAGARTSGNNSIFSSITSTGGGGGGTEAGNGLNGGSGGGAGFTGTGGIGTSGGNNGGVGFNASSESGGGGGGAGAVGSNAPDSSYGGNGGVGLSSSISGSSLNYAGGGGGGNHNQTAGGTASFGGGAGAKTGTATAGTSNTGGGGGGSGDTGTGAKGGSGIVVISYTTTTSTNVPVFGVNQTSPTAELHLGAGTANASTAPLKFTSGTNLSIAEAGAMEFDGTSLYFTPSTVRNTILMGSSTTLNYKIGGTAVRGTTEGTNHLDVFNGTPPAGTLANGFSIYSAAGLAYAIDAAGVRTAVSVAHTIFTPVTTASITLINNQNNLVDPAGTIAVLTMVFPASPANNDFVFVKFTQIVTAITYTAGTGGATIKSQVNGVVGGFEKWTYDSGNNTWY